MEAEGPAGEAADIGLAGHDLVDQAVGPGLVGAEVAASAEVSGDLGLRAADRSGQSGDEVVDLALELGGPAGQVVGPAPVGRPRLPEQDVGKAWGLIDDVLVPRRGVSAPTVAAAS